MTNQIQEFWYSYDYCYYYAYPSVCLFTCGSGRYITSIPLMIIITIIIKFSTLDNAFRILWLVHSILVISLYTLVWPYISVAKLKMFSPESVIFLWIKPKKKKKTFVESLDQCRRLEVREKARNVFSDEPTSVWPQGVTQHRIFISSFFDFARIFSLFSLVFRTSNFWF